MFSKKVKMDAQSEHAMQSKIALLVAVEAFFRDIHLDTLAGDLGTEPHFRAGPRA